MKGLAGLREFVRPREVRDRCDGCGAVLPEAHLHQLRVASGRVRCACANCAAGSDDWVDIPDRVKALADFRMTDADWNDLAIPISLAFFVVRSVTGQTTAHYPGPAGAVESGLPLEVWREIMDANPELAEMLADVEVLLVNRIGAHREYWIIPIDECFRLVALIRLHWHGLSGGAQVWGQISEFFDGLRSRSERRSDREAQELCPA